jgi:hypothetical protein
VGSRGKRVFRLPKLSPGIFSEVATIQKRGKAATAHHKRRIE